MSVVKTMNEHDFINAMGDDFSYSGSKALFQYYDDMEEPVEFDRVAIRSDWAEYDSYEEIWNDKGNGTQFIEGEELAIDWNIRLWLENRTTYLQVGDDEAIETILVQEF